MKLIILTLVVATLLSGARSPAQGQQVGGNASFNFEQVRPLLAGRGDWTLSVEENKAIASAVAYARAHPENFVATIRQYLVFPQDDPNAFNRESFTAGVILLERSGTPDARNLLTEIFLASTSYLQNSESGGIALLSVRNASLDALARLGDRSLIPYAIEALAKLSPRDLPQQVTLIYYLHQTAKEDRNVREFLLQLRDKQPLGSSLGAAITGTLEAWAKQDELEGHRAGRSTEEARQRSPFLPTGVSPRPERTGAQASLPRESPVRPSVGFLSSENVHGWIAAIFLGVCGILVWLAKSSRMK